MDEEITQTVWCDEAKQQKKGLFNWDKKLVIVKRDKDVYLKIEGFKGHNFPFSTEQ